MTSDGFVKVIEEKNHKILFKAKKHRLPVTAMSFICDTSGNA